MRISSLHSLIAVIGTGLSIAVPATGLAQVNPAFSDMAGVIEEARMVLQGDRKEIIRQAMDMTPEEEARFWPVYDRYAASMNKINDKRVKLITDYAAKAWRMNDEVADDLLKTGLDYLDDAVDLREDYLNDFKRVLPTVKVARFYQLEHKLDAITDFALAREIPLIPPAEKPLNK